MSDTSKDDEDSSSNNNNSLPTVIYTDSTEPENSQPNLSTSESKLSLPSAVGTPTSPLLVNSPLSLPNSPTPFVKTLQTIPNKSFEQSLHKSPTKQNTMKPADSGSATGW
ncbi:unnamed protein product [Leptosia nina]|uniref:Uncharacterized protein n=1 Tax=Leptosia nina TaxID=320188 RepID=A0AAV1K3S6_9NEOP